MLALQGVLLKANQVLSCLDSVHLGKLAKCVLCIHLKRRERFTLCGVDIISLIARMQEFWHSRVTNILEVWQTIHAACDAILEGNAELAATMIEVLF